MSVGGGQVLARVPLPSCNHLQLVIMLENRLSDTAVVSTSPGVAQPEDEDQTAVFNVQLGVRRDPVLRALLVQYQLPRYRLLDMVLDHVQAKENSVDFRKFLQTYQDPRRISGGQVHFQICSRSQHFLKAMSWEFVQGNRSMVARAAMDFVCR